MYIVPNLFKYIKFSYRYITVTSNKKERKDILLDYINYNNLRNDLYNIKNIMILTDNIDACNYNVLKMNIFISDNYKDILNFHDVNIFIIDICSNYNVYLILNIFRYIININNNSQLIFKIERDDEIVYELLYILSSVYDKIIVKRMSSNYNLIICNICNVSNIDVLDYIIAMLEASVRKNELNITKLYDSNIPQIFKNKLLEILKNTSLQT